MGIKNTLLKYINAKGIGSYINEVNDEPIDITAIQLGAIVQVDDNITIKTQTGLNPLFVDNNSLAVIGDSFTANGFYKSATTEELSSGGFVTHALALSGQRLKLVCMAAVGGSGITADINGLQFDKQLTIAIQSGAKNLMVMGGINDCNTDVPTNTIIASYSALITRAVNAGMRVFVCTQPTQNSSFATYTAARQAAQLKVQEWLRQYCQRKCPVNVILIDCAKTCVDPASTTASYLTGYTTDGLHPNNKGAYVIGKEIARVWSKCLPECGDLISSNADNTNFSSTSNNLLPNGLMISSTSGVATGFTTSVGGTAVIGTPTVVARADGIGNDQVLPITFSAANDYARLTSATVANFNDGDTLYGEAEITVSSPVNVGNIRMGININGNIVTKTAAYNQKYSGGDVAILEAVTYVIRTPEITYDASIQGATHNSMITVTVTGLGAGSCTLKVGRMALKKVIK